MTEHNAAVTETPTTRPAVQADSRHEYYMSPPVDIYELADGFALVADLPGVSQDHLEVNVSQNVLTIKGHISQKLPGQARFHEYESAPVLRQFRLSNALDTDRVDAQLRNGVLRLRIRKAEAAVPRQVEIKVA